MNRNGRAAARYPAYDSYRASGEAWLGDIPSHWSVARISEAAQVVNGYPFDSEFFTHSEGIPLVRIRDLDSRETEVNYTGPVVANAWIDPGDVLIGMDGDFNVGRWRGGRALLNQRMCCIRPLPGVDGAFLAHMLPFPLKAINDLTYSTTVKHLSSGDVRNIRFARPPLGEQRGITAFLGRETAKIDALVAKKERFVDSLRAKRDALVTVAVTEGSGCRARKKDSGVPFLGAVPEHWEVLRLRTLADGLGVGVVVNPSSYVEDDGLPFLYGSDIEPNRIDVSRARRISDTNSRALRSSRLRAGDLVMVRVGAPGVTAAVPPELEGANCASLLIIRRSPKFVPQWLCYALNSRYVRAQVEMVQYGAAQEQFNVAHAKNFVVAVPPLPEQRQIVLTLDRELGKLQMLEHQIGLAIAHLRARRTALITAAVTGKIDVRGEVA